MAYKIKNTIAESQVRLDIIDREPVLLEDGELILSNEEFAKNRKQIDSFNYTLEVEYIEGDVIVAPQKTEETEKERKEREKAEKKAADELKKAEEKAAAEKKAADEKAAAEKAEEEKKEEAPEAPAADPAPEALAADAATEETK